MNTITLRNDFHNSEASVRVDDLPHRLSRAQISRLRRELCGSNDCTCGGNLGERGPQDVIIDVGGYDGEGIIITLRND